MKKLLISMAALFAPTIVATAQVDSTFTIQGDHGKLAVHLQLPEIAKGEKLPMTIVCHGFTGNQNEPHNTLLANDLLDEGFGVVRFDFNAHGKSEGNFEEMTVPNECVDLTKVIEWVEVQPYTKNISVTGHSLGGLVLSIVAGQIGNGRIHASALLAPGAVGRDRMLLGIFQDNTFDPWNMPEYIVNKRGLKIGRGYMETLRDLPIYDIAKQYQGPTLVVNGTHDKVVPLTYAEHYANYIPNAELWLIEGDNHMFSKNQKETMSKVAKWLKKQQSK